MAMAVNHGFGQLGQLGLALQLDPNTPERIIQCICDVLCRLTGSNPRHIQLSGSQATFLCIGFPSPASTHELEPFQSSADEVLLAIGCLEANAQANQELLDLLSFHGCLEQPAAKQNTARRTVTATTTTSSSITTISEPPDALQATAPASGGAGINPSSHEPTAPTASHNSTSSQIPVQALGGLQAAVAGAQADPVAACSILRPLNQPERVVAQHLPASSTEAVGQPHTRLHPPTADKAAADSPAGPDQDQQPAGQEAGSAAGVSNAQVSSSAGPLSHGQPALLLGSGSDGRVDQLALPATEAPLGLGAEAVSRMAEQQMIPLLKRCGILQSVFPLHDAATVESLKHKVFSQLLAPVEDFRSYFGDEVGFYLAYLNTVGFWLLPSSVVSAVFMGACQVDKQQQGISSPFIPVLVAFQLLWSAANLKLWQQQQTALTHRWQHHTGTSSSTSTSSSSHRVLPAGPADTPTASTPPYPATAGAAPGLVQPGAAPSAPSAHPASEVAVGSSSQPVRGAPTQGPIAMPTAAAQIPSRHLGQGLPAWAVLTPIAAGARRQFSGRWQYNSSTGELELIEPLILQLMRLAASIMASVGLLSAAAVVLLMCLNLQGLIYPKHSSLYMPGLAGLSQPGALFGSGVLSQVPMVVRVAATTLFGSLIFKPAAKALTGLENRRTVEGFSASLTAKQAALQLLFTFVPVVYVGLAGAGATAAAADVGGYFKVELARRLTLELLLPWASLWRAAKREKAPAGMRTTDTTSPLAQETLAVAAAPDGQPADRRQLSSLSMQQQQQQLRQRRRQQQSQTPAELSTATARMLANADAPSSLLSSTHQQQAAVAAAVPQVSCQPGTLSAPSAAQSIGNDAADAAAGAPGRFGIIGAESDVLKPAYSLFDDVWEVTRDLGYVLLFASICPWAVPLTLMYTLVKIKQDCLKLLLLYRRPMPRHLHSLGIWNFVLTAQVFLSVLTSVFLSGLSSGQLVQLLPHGPWASAGLSRQLIEAAASRPAASSAGSQMGQPGTDWPPTPLEVLQAASLTSSASGTSMGGPAACMAGNTLAGAGSIKADSCPAPNLMAAALKSSAAAPVAASDGGVMHLLLLFILEHVLVLLMLLVMRLIPSEPPTARANPPQLSAGASQPGVNTQQCQVQRGKQSEDKAAMSASSPVSSSDVPVKVHVNPLFTQSTARKGGSG